MERLEVKSAAEVFSGIKVGDTIRAKLAGCVNSFQKRLSKSGNKYAFLELSDGTSNFEGLLFSEGLAKYEEVINSGMPLLVSIVITKESEETNPRVMINSVETLDQAIANVANGLIIYINNVAAVRQIKEILSKDRNGTNKIYINFFILPILRFKQKRDYPEKTVPQFIPYNLSASGRDSLKKLIEAFLVEPLGSFSD